MDEAAYPSDHRPGRNMMTTVTSRHLAALESLGFRGDWDKLTQLERYAHRRAEFACNGKTDLGQVYTSSDWDADCETIKTRFRRLFDRYTTPSPYQFNFPFLTVNGDPRGYALKYPVGTHPVPDGMHQDWGGDGIYAPIENIAGSWDEDREVAHAQTCEETPRHAAGHCETIALR
jgi:hypothetical protein